LGLLSMGRAFPVATVNGSLHAGHGAVMPMANSETVMRWPQLHVTSRSMRLTILWRLAVVHAALDVFLCLFRLVMERHGRRERRAHFGKFRVHFTDTFRHHTDDIQ